MRKFFIILSIIVSIAIISIASYFIYKEIRQNKYNKKARAICAEMHLPTIDIKTEKGKLPKDKENYVNCSFKISNCENEKYNIEIKMAEKYGSKDSVGIRLRGNSTSKLPKKPYRIKFGDEQEILGLTEAKSWVLLADYFDYSNMKNYTAFNFAKKLNNMDFAPSANHVALFLNGDFKGLYLLTEQMDEKEGRTNVEPEVDFTAEDKEFPFLIEMDRSASKEGCKIHKLAYFILRVRRNYPLNIAHIVIIHTDKIIKFIVVSFCHLTGTLAFAAFVSARKSPFPRRRNPTNRSSCFVPP